MEKYVEKYDRSKQNPHDLKTGVGAGAPQPFTPTVVEGVWLWGLGGPRGTIGLPPCGVTVRPEPQASLGIFCAQSSSSRPSLSSSRMV